MKRYNVMKIEMNESKTVSSQISRKTSLVKGWWGRKGGGVGRRGECPTYLAGGGRWIPYPPDLVSLCPVDRRTEKLRTLPSLVLRWSSNGTLQSFDDMTSLPQQPISEKCHEQKHIDMQNLLFLVYVIIIKVASLSSLSNNLMGGISKKREDECLSREVPFN